MHASHLPERYGLFTIIVLGESLVAVVVGISGTDWQLASAVTAAVGFLAAACLWWVYFDFIELADIRRGLLARNVFIYGHLLVAMGLTATGVGIKKAILYSGEPYLPVGGYWALCGGTALFLAGISLVYVVSTRTMRDRVMIARGAATVAALSLALIGPAVTPSVLVCLLLLVLISLVVFEMIEKAAQTTHKSTSTIEPETTKPDS